MPAPKGNNHNPNGRPRNEIDWNLIDNYLKAGCSQIKIAKRFSIHPDTLRDRLKDKYGVDYSTYSSSLHSEGEMALEMKQHEKALEGNTQMLIYLGEVRLKQRREEKGSGGVEFTVTHAKNTSPN